MVGPAQTLLTTGDPGDPLVERIYEVGLAVLGVTRSGMCLVGGRRRQIVVHSADPLSKELEDLQLTLGEGPCMQAVRTGSPVAAPDLVEAPAVAWPSFAEQAVARGVRALFSYPLRVSYPVRGGSVHLGVLDLYRDSPGPLTESQQLDAVLLTEIASRAMLAQKDRASLDRSVSALRWLTGEERLTGTGWGRAVDLGITVSGAPRERFP